MLAWISLWESFGRTSGSVPRHAIKFKLARESIMTEAAHFNLLPADKPKKSHDLQIVVSAAFMLAGLIVALYAMAQTTGISADELSKLTAYP
jgi:hypothetical protein